MLRDPVKLDAFLDAVFSNAEGPISVKTRLGVEKPEEFAAILDIYNRYPICELTIHPRVMRQLYRGQADRAAFAAALPRCTDARVLQRRCDHRCGPAQRWKRSIPQLSGIMVGRGIIADPALFREGTRRRTGRTGRAARTTLTTSTTATPNCSAAPGAR